jgi:L-ascorbate metabolism protein UlaG (beta-lactamase superfamily)
MFEFNGVKLTWLGHDGFRIEDGQVIYIDPYEIEGGVAADLILISHEHDDHCSLNDLKKLVTSKTVLVAHSQSKNKLSKLPAKELKIAKPGDKLALGSVTVEAVPAYNTNKFREPGKLFHPKEDGKLGFIVTVKGVRIYHAADTDHITEMNGMMPDIALLPVSGTYVMTAKEAAEAAASIKPKVAVPMHYASIVGSAKDAEDFKKLAKCEVRIMQKEQ